MRGGRLTDRIRNTTPSFSKERTDIDEYVTKAKWQRVGHTARTKDNRPKDKEDYFLQWKDTA